MLTLSERPDECDDQGFIGGVIGKWFVSSADDDHCMPHWGSLGDDGCTGFGKHQWWSRLWYAMRLYSVQFLSS